MQIGPSTLEVLMKWLFLLFSVVRPFLSSGGSHEMPNPVKEIREMIKANAMKVVALFATASALATIFAAGIVIIAVDVGAQYDQNAYVYFSSMIMMGLVLSLVSLVIGAIIMKVVQKENESFEREKREAVSHTNASHPLQDAIALLIQDFVKEREFKREEQAHTSTERAQPPSEQESQRHH